MQWSDEQLKVIEAAANDRVLVLAAPGTGKTAVACARIARLVEQYDCSASRILMISFTRTAVAEVRDRIRAALTSREAAASVQIATIDSLTYGLRDSYEAKADKHAAGGLSYESNIRRLAQLLDANGDAHGDALRVYLESYEHVLVDEAQDIVGARADVVAGLVDALTRNCGVTVLGDPHQGIYGFTTDEDKARGGEPPNALLDLLAQKRFRTERLTELHRTKDAKLSSTFRMSRDALDGPGDPQDRYEALRDAIESSAAGTGHSADLKDLRSADQDLLVLYRRRSDVLMASSYLSTPDRRGGQVQHRLRLGGVAPPIHPWVGFLLGDQTERFQSISSLEALWEAKGIHPILGDQHRDTAIGALMRAGREGKNLSMEKLRAGLARSRPPVELCATELGTSGPILSTIHASKGREADKVWLFIPPGRKRSSSRGEDSTENSLDAEESTETSLEEPDDVNWTDEGRVLYVGATRPRVRLETGHGFLRGSTSLPNGRVVRSRRQRDGRVMAQVQVGLDGDVLPGEHGTWTDAQAVQELLASLYGSSRSTCAKYSSVAHAYELFVEVREREQRIALLSPALNSDLWEVAKMTGAARPPPALRFIHVIALATVAIFDESERQKLQPPFNESGLILAPVVKGLSVGSGVGAPPTPGRKRGGGWKRNSR
jgi:hypothetical protein